MGRGVLEDGLTFGNTLTQGGRAVNGREDIMTKHDASNAGKIAILESQIEELKRERGELIEALKEVTDFLPQLSSFPKKTETRQGTTTKKIYDLLAKHGVTL